MSSEENAYQQSNETTSVDEVQDLESPVEDIEPHCYWCNKAKPEIKELLESKYQKRNKEDIEFFFSCSHEHESRTTNFLRFAEKFYFVYTIFMFVVPVVLLVISVILLQYLFVFGFSVFISLGIGLTFLPLLGNQLVINIGLKKSILLGRILGAILIIIGVILVLTFGLAYFE